MSHQPPKRQRGGEKAMKNEEGEEGGGRGDGPDLEEVELEEAVFGLRHDHVLRARRDDDDDDDDQDDDQDDQDEEEELVRKGRRRASAKDSTSKPGKKEVSLSHVDSEELFRIDMGEEAGEEEEEEEEERGGPAWTDEDDQGVRVSLTRTDRLRKLRKNLSENTVSGKAYEERLREQHEKLQSSRRVQATDARDPRAWAKRNLPGEKKNEKNKSLKERKADEEAQEIVSGVMHTSDSKLVKSAVSALADGILRVSRLRNANAKGKSKCVIQATDWHSSSQVFLTGGLDHRLRLFRVDGDANEKLSDSFFPDLPIVSAEFGKGGGEAIVVCSGRRPFYYLTRLTTGQSTRTMGIWGREGEKSLETMRVLGRDRLAFGCKGGVVSIVSLGTRREVAALQLSVGQVSEIVGVPSATGGGDQEDSPYVMAGSAHHPEVYLFDLRMAGRLPVWVRRDPASMGTRSLAASSSLYACGSNAGVVSVYNLDDGKLVRTLDNLTTAVDRAEFTHDGALLAYASSRKKDCLSIYHVPSNRIVRNWPTSSTPLSYVSDVGFSPRGGFMHVGNDKGEVLLYRLHAYESV